MTVLVMSGPIIVSPMVAASSASFKDPRSGLEVAPPAGFTAEVQQATDKGEDPITIRSGKNACLVDLLRRPACERMASAAELTVAAHRLMDMDAALGAAEPIHVGPLAGVLLEGTSKIPQTDARIYVAILASTTGRVFVACKSAPDDDFAQGFEAMIRSIRLP